MTKNLDGLNAQMQAMTERADREGKDWRQRWTLSLAVGNGAGLLSFFSQVKDIVKVGNPEPLVMVPAWLFLAGLIFASFAPYVWAQERGHFSVTMFSGASIITSEDDEDEDEVEAHIKSEYRKAYAKSYWVIPWLSRLAIGFEILSASTFVTAVSISLLLIGGVI